ncbi:MAG: VPLPA-CTERM sorting domain-containing protein [Pseudomonadota bacterium]
MSKLIDFNPFASDTRVDKIRKPNRQLWLCAGLLALLPVAGNAATFNATSDFTLSINASSTDDLVFSVFPTSFSTSDAPDPLGVASASFDVPDGVSMGDGDALPSSLRASASISGDTGPSAGSFVLAQAVATGFALDITNTGTTPVTLFFGVTDQIDVSLAALDAPDSNAVLNADLAFNAIAPGVLNQTSVFDLDFDIANDPGELAFSDAPFGIAPFSFELSPDVPSITLQVDLTLSGSATLVVELAPVPLPATAWMLIAGLGALGASGRLKRRKNAL